MQPLSVVFVNGKFSEELSCLNILPNAVECEAEQVVFRIPSYLRITQPIFLKFLNDKTLPMHNFLPCHIEVGPEAVVTIIEEHDTAFLAAKKWEIQLTLHQLAKVNYCKFQKSRQTNNHYQAFLKIYQSKFSELNLILADCGRGAADTKVEVYLQESHARCNLLGIYHLFHDKQILSNDILVSHLSPHVQSSMIFKGVLHKKSQAYFTGKVFVDKSAHSTVAHQANHNLLLSPQAEVYSKPYLEIYAEDIKCTHGATVGQINEDALFYMRSRGLSHEAALQLLITAFAADVLILIRDTHIRGYVEQRIHNYEIV